MSKNMQGFGMMIQKLKASPKKIVFTEGTDERILEATSRLLASSFLTPILVGKEDEVHDGFQPFGSGAGQRTFTPHLTCSPAQHLQHGSGLQRQG